MERFQPISCDLPSFFILNVFNLSIKRGNVGLYSRGSQECGFKNVMLPNYTTLLGMSPGSVFFFFLQGPTTCLKGFDF